MIPCEVTLGIMHSKIFIGFRLPNDLIHKKKFGDEILYVIYKGRHYIGDYLKKERATLGDLRLKSSEIVHQLSLFFPELHFDGASIVIFSQIFIG
jgi:hypothetical protein